MHKSHTEKERERERLRHERSSYQLRKRQASKGEREKEARKGTEAALDSFLSILQQVAHSSCSHLRNYCWIGTRPSR